MPCSSSLSFLASSVILPYSDLVVERAEFELPNSLAIELRVEYRLDALLSAVSRVDIS